MNGSVKKMNEFRSWNPDSVQPVPHPHSFRLPIRQSYFDPHLDPGLTLRHVRIVPSLQTEIGKVLDDKLTDLEGEGRDLIGSLSEKLFPAFGHANPHLSDGTGSTKSVAAAYSANVASPCISLASNVLFPDAPEWFLAGVFDWKEIPEVEDSPVRECSLEISTSQGEFRLIDRPLYTRGGSMLTVEEQDMLGLLVKGFAHLATYEILPLADQSEAVLRNMGDWDDLSAQCSEAPPACSLLYGRSLPFSMIPDVNSASSPWKERREDKTEPLSSNSIRPPVLVHSIKDQNETFRRREGDFTSSLLKKTWCDSVRQDTSMIVIHCGSLERIGFRHRASQTLYLSDVIDVSSCADPCYGVLHTSVVIAAFQEAIRRFHFRTMEEAPKFILKRKHCDAETPTQSPRSPLELSKKEIASYVERLDIALATFRFGPYNSQAPAVWLRECLHADFSPKILEEERRLLPHEYCSVIITTKLGSGAVGQVYGGFLLISTADGVCSVEVAVKMTFKRQDQASLMHEYSIYQSLIHYSVKSVPTVFGLFRDVLAGGPLFLVLSHEGTSLRKLCSVRDKADAYTNIKVTEAERHSFKKALKEVHGAGIRHNDIRPENLVKDSAGNVSIIDFDQAALYASESAQKRELHYLDELLEGAYTHPSQYSRSSNSFWATDPYGDDETSDESDDEG